ncbi:LCP family protein [Candidatus Saccharibacteria bacterium]|nr:LCP family protein [Candidatus Saccharibacteria bacterium]
MEEKKVKKSRKVWKIVGFVFVVLLLIAIGVVLRYVIAYNGFLDKITERKPEMKEYSVIVMQNRNIQKIEELNGKSVGLLKTDTKANNAAQYLKNLVDVEVDFYDDLGSLMTMLKNDITDSVALETDRLEMIKEEEANLINEVKVIYTFKIELENEMSEIPDKKITAEPFIVYISGSDSRNGVKATARSDVNIVVVVNPSAGKILLVSIPRDTYVQLNGTTGIKDKLTHAGVYGIDMSKKTIEDFLGITIDYTIKVSFETVVKVVDELDGIDIVSDRTMTLKDNGNTCEYIEGKQHVNGPCALRFARERKSYSSGDRHRGENQQQVITGIIGRLSGSKDYLLKIPTILDIAADSFETDIPRDEVASFIRLQLTQGIKWQVESVSVDGTGTYEPTYSMGINRPLYVLIPSDSSVENVRNKINSYLANEPDGESVDNSDDGLNE